MLAAPADNTLQQLHQRIASGQCRVGIYGLGYVGLPLALRFTKMGIAVTGFDTDPQKVAMLNAGTSYIERIKTAEIQAAQASGFTATTDFSQTAQVDAQIICVPTPLDQHNQPDLSFVINTVEGILPHFKSGQIMSLESTTWPGTTQELLQPRLEQQGFTPGTNCALVYSPEREDPGNANYSTESIPKIIGGITANCLQLGTALYQHAITTLVPVSNPKVAEMTKLLENIHRAVNIGLVNEMKIVADKMGINIHEVIQAAATKPFGFVPYKPGPGLGGHCIPIDPFYLTWKAKEYGINTRFIELSGEVNRAMPAYVLSKLVDGLNEQRKALKGSKILIVGIAYKKNIDDMRESPAVEIMQLIEEKGGILSYSDPHIPSFPKLRKDYFNLDSIEITSESLASYDAVVLITDHDFFDYPLIEEHSSLIIDTRNAYKHTASNIIKA